MTAPVPPGSGGQAFGAPAYGPETYGVPGQPSQYGYAGPPPDPTSVVGRRIGAFFIDATFIAILITLAFFLMADHSTISSADRKYSECRAVRNSLTDNRDIECDWPKISISSDPDAYVADGPPFFGVTALLSFLYYVVPQAFAGCTLGKLMVGIRVVRADGNMPGLGRAFVRWIVFLVDGPLTIYICGLVTMLTSKGHRRLGDMAAGTYVISRAAAGQPVTIAPPQAPYYPPQQYQAPPGYPPPPAAYPPPPATAYPPPPAAYPPPPASPDQAGWAAPPPGPAAAPPPVPPPPSPAPPSGDEPTPPS